MPGPATHPIVVAGHGETLALLRACLPARFVLAGASTVAQARGLVTADTPLVLCDPHFDDGRMYDLLRWMKGRGATQGVPFLAIRVREGELDDTLYESVKIATQALGGNGFIDLFRWQVRFGSQQAARRLGEHVQALASGTAPPGEDTAYGPP